MGASGDKAGPGEDRRYESALQHLQLPVEAEGPALQAGHVGGQIGRPAHSEQTVQVPGMDHPRILRRKGQD